MQPKREAAEIRQVCPHFGIAAALAAQGFRAEHVDEIAGEDVIGPVVDELVLVLEITLTLLLEELDTVFLLVELEVLVAGTIDVEVLPGKMVVVVEVTVLRADVVELPNLVTEAAADKHEQTLAAELRAERAGSSPHAFVAHGRAAITIDREIDGTHWQE